MKIAGDKLKQCYLRMGQAFVPDPHISGACYTCGWSSFKGAWTGPEGCSVGALLLCAAFIDSLFETKALTDAAQFMTNMGMDSSKRLPHSRYLAQGGSAFVQRGENYCRSKRPAPGEPRVVHAPPVRFVLGHRSFRILGGLIIVFSPSEEFGIWAPPRVGGDKWPWISFIVFGDQRELEDGEELARLGCLRGPYHEECVNARVQVHGLDFANFPCPECRTAERQLQSMEAARLQRQQVVSSSGSSAAAGRRRAAVFRTPLTQGGERRITRESRRSRSPPPRVVADSPIMQPESPGGAIVAAASPIGRAVAPAASPIGRGLSQSISPSQSQPSRPQGPAITDADFGFTFTDNTAAGGDGAPVPDPCLRRADAVPNAAAFQTALHPTGLFNGLQDERGTRGTAEQWLGEMLADPRDHKEVGMDPSFSIRLLPPRPFRTAVVAVASREGWQPEALMQGIMSNAGWLEHHATVLKEHPGAPGGIWAVHAEEGDQCPRRCAEEAPEALGARNAQQGFPRAQRTLLPPGIPRAQYENSALWRRGLLRALPRAARQRGSESAEHALGEAAGGAAGAPGAARSKKLRKDAPARRRGQPTRAERCKLPTSLETGVPLGAQPSSSAQLPHCCSLRRAASRASGAREPRRARVDQGDGGRGSHAATGSGTGSWADRVRQSSLYPTGLVDGMFPRMNQSRDEFEVCAICLEALACFPATPFLVDSRPGSRATCVHYCHHACARRLVARRCPVCRAAFAGLKNLTREGILTMSEAELCLALRRLHGRAEAHLAVGLLSALFPVSVQRLTELMSGIDEGCVTAEGLAGVLNALGVPEAPPRAGPRLWLLKACRAAGGALNGCFAGFLVGAGVGLWLKEPPSHDEQEKVSRPHGGSDDHGAARHPFTIVEGSVSIIREFCEQGLLGIAVVTFLLVLVVVVLPALIWLLRRCWRLVAVALRSGHRAIWVAAAARAGAGAPAQVGRLLWGCSLWLGVGLGVLCGFLHGAKHPDAKPVREG
ncbi:unnamed protein product [Prorocentrum cordatum]|uniref:RING-type domain-containing protein n=1 Tax=Prorocentrum cordatum TaxID=2364126 RepID=A0ABN9TBI8_9DINO|nr:unnamed protein product [Polarella glacialis]